VQIVQRWILALLRRQSFTSIHEINNQIRLLLDRLNDKVMKHLGISRRKLFEDVEQSALKALPVERFSIPEWKIAKVSIDYHVEFERHYYSVPYRFVGKTVDVKATHATVEIFEGGRRIAIHPRNTGHPGRHTTKPEHMPASHKAYAEWTPERIVGWAEDSGPSVAELCQKILVSRPHPEQGFRSCLGILRLGKNYGKERLDKACEMALRMKSLRYRTIQYILRNESDRNIRVLKPVESSKIDHHENIRGADYYN
jgi:transposase